MSEIEDLMLESLKRQKDSELSSLGFIKKLNDINCRYGTKNNGIEKDTFISMAENLVEIKCLLKEIRLILKNGK